MDGGKLPSGSLGPKPNSSPKLSPKQFLKARQPERFSDSEVCDVPSLDRTVLEYHLDTLTSRSEELIFEDFAKALLQRTVCPNLLPHTGPSGGGDSKVDSETYPVASVLSAAWYVGQPDKASSERWAFAFSAKQKWRTKVRSDVKKLAETERGYTKAFFVSNQFIRDKDRAEVEDALSNEHGIDLRIFDRTWILDQVFDNKLEVMTVDRLQMSVEISREDRKGPRDTGRQQEFDQVEAEIDLAIQEARESGSIVGKCLRSAELARAMERPRAEVDGLFFRANRMAKEYGTPHQQLLCSYSWAWTSFWWHESYTAFLEQYDEVERQAKGSQNPHALELWCNLFSCLTVIARQQHFADKVDTTARAEVLIDSLASVVRQHNRPSASLHASSLMVQVRLLTATPEEHDALLDSLAAIAQKADGLVGYPFDQLSNFVNEFGDVFDELPGYQRLFEVTVAASTRRAGEVVGARMMLRRGERLLEAGQSYDAIRVLGRVMGRLFKHESRDDAVHALYLCSHAYERVGLLWAARGTALSAASLATNDYWTNETLSPQQAACYNRIKWIELRLGRLGPMLAWHELDQVLRSALINRGCTIKWVSQDDNFDAVAGILMLKADLQMLKELTRLPDVLRSAGLPASAAALLFALGHEAELPAGLNGDGGAAEFFRKWRDQPAYAELPEFPESGLGPTICFSSSIAGCRVDVACANETPCLELGESLLACLEALLATAVIDRIVSREPLVRIRITAGEPTEPWFDTDFEDVGGLPSVEICCGSFSPHELTKVEQVDLKKRLFDVLSNVLARAFLLPDAEGVLTSLFRDDLAPQRALDFATSFVVIANVLGDDAKTKLNQWFDSNDTEYALVRSQVWDEAELAEKRRGQSATEPESASVESEFASGLRDAGHVTHDEIRNVSLIRESLWDGAGWRGVAVATVPDSSEPPVLALVFENSDAGLEIFKAWHEELGGVDRDERLRVSVIRNIRRDKPNWYRVAFGTNLEGDLFSRNVKQVVTGSRSHTMTPDSGENLDRFIAAFERAGEFILGQVKQTAGELSLASVNQIRKRRIIFKEAWQVGPDDPDSINIRPEDDPLIPEGVDYAPVIETLKRNRRTK